ncbi:MAG: phosphoribosylaminoimidazolesuccinocarboxamide synthase [Clostridiales bacterium]|nr:phosphoribosylaminoimidazolesuccinocarboxamide synthase [Clostridiales bacterium]MCF8021687.1 phosphoribosylaminoimidazolesuccinocarboxamide synthase [Clostridiales bacterium]
MEKKDFLYQGKAKCIYKTDDPDVFLVEYRDDATAYNGAKKGTITGKGSLNNQISTYFFELLQNKGIPTHYVEYTGLNEMLVKSLDIIAVEVVVRNIAAGSLARRLGMEEGTVLPGPVVEYYYKSDELGDPLINDDHIKIAGLASKDEMQYIKETALKINDILIQDLNAKNLDLVDYKLEFGRHKSEILLGDEISPDTCRFWDKDTREKLDKDRFRRDMGSVEDAYIEVRRRLTGK